MRIRIRPSAQQHGITDAEIRAVINHYALSLPITARRQGARPVFYTGAAAPNQPWIEVIADYRDPAVADVFHAMMLRRSVVTALGIADLIDPQYGPQRA